MELAMEFKKYFRTNVSEYAPPCIDSLIGYLVNSSIVYSVQSQERHIVSSKILTPWAEKVDAWNPLLIAKIAMK
jgi:hypothetical protein